MVRSGPCLPVERETKFVIEAEEPKSVVREICRLEACAGYHIVPGISQTIRDLYFDTEAEKMEASGLGLRIRRVDSEQWITLKGPPREAGRGITERFELDRPWSEEALAIVQSELMDRGIELKEAGAAFDPEHPVQTLTNAGLQVVQHRETHRAIRKVVQAEGGVERTLAELAVDSVIYYFGQRRIRHYEVEIEVESENGSTALEEVSEELLIAFGKDLRRSGHSKLAIGKAVEKLIRQESLERLVDAQQNLRPTAYEKIEQILTRSV